MYKAIIRYTKAMVDDNIIRKYVISVLQSPKRGHAITLLAMRRVCAVECAVPTHTRNVKLNRQVRLFQHVKIDQFLGFVSNSRYDPGIQMGTCSQRHCNHAHAAVRNASQQNFEFAFAHAQ
jgi:hypothetical protein